MSSRRLSCAGCRIHVRASSPNIALLEGNCPICEAKLRPVSSASSVMGFRSFDLDVLSEHDANGSSLTPGEPVDLDAHRRAAPSRAYVDVERWPREGGRGKSWAAADRLTAH